MNGMNGTQYTSLYRFMYTQIYEGFMTVKQNERTYIERTSPNYFPTGSRIQNSS